MAIDKKTLSAKRFGARYGRRVKHKVGIIESTLKGKHKCPYCHSMKAKRVSSGIWNCEKCKSKFTGRAYTAKKTAVIESKVKAQEEA